MAWIVAPNMESLRATFNRRFPQRDKTSDGTIGDAGHRLGRSSHNPDDTPGSLAEFTDADTIPEVRAFDADEDLRDPGGVTMDDCLEALLATPEDLARLEYIIYERVSYSDDRGWRGAPYSGDNPHDKHIHFSGKAAADANGAPWKFIDKLPGGKMLELTTTAKVGNYLADPRYPAAGETQTLHGLWAGAYYYSIVSKRDLDELKAAAAADAQRDTAALTAINALAAIVSAGGGNVDVAAIIAEVRAVGAETHGMITMLQEENRELRERLAAAYRSEG